MTKNTEERIPEEAIDPKSKIAREADAFLNAIAGGADEDEADEAAFLEVNPNGVVVDEEGDVLKKGCKSAIEVGTKVEFEEGEAEQPEDDCDEDYAESKKDCAEPVEEEQHAVEDAADRAPANETVAEESDINSDDELAEDTEPADEALVTFEDLGLADEVLEAIKALNYETPSPIQAKAIPALLQGANLLGTAQTGTGKTAAFSLPAHADPRTCDPGSRSHPAVCRQNAEGACGSGLRRTGHRRTAPRPQAPGKHRGRHSRPPD